MSVWLNNVAHFWTWHCDYKCIKPSRFGEHFKTVLFVIEVLMYIFGRCTNLIWLTLFGYAICWSPYFTCNLEEFAEIKVLTCNPTVIRQFLSNQKYFIWAVEVDIRAEFIFILNIFVVDPIVNFKFHKSNIHSTLSKDVYKYISKYIMESF